MGVEAQLPTIITVVATAAIDSINPCAIGVLILMISTVLAAHGSPKKLLQLGGIYIFAVFLFYLLAGLGLLVSFAKIPLVVAEYVSIAVATLLVWAGLVEVKDYFWYGKGLSLGIPPVFAKMIPGLASRTTLMGMFLLGGFVAAVELPCTGAPYLAIITILSQYFDLTAFLLLVLYNFVFVAPLIVILLIVALGQHRLEHVKIWREGARGRMRLAIGVLMILLSWLLILIANGSINLG